MLAQPRRLTLCCEGALIPMFSHAIYRSQSWDLIERLGHVDRGGGSGTSGRFPAMCSPRGTLDAGNADDRLRRKE